MNSTKRNFILVITLITIISIGLMIGVYFSGQSVFSKQIEDRLLSAVTDMSQKLKASSGMETEDMVYKVGDVYISVYADGGDFINGVIPSEDISNINFSEGVIRREKVGGEAYLIYDVEVTFVNRSSLIVRGVASAQQSTISTILTFFIVATLILTIISALALYFSIKKARQPIRDMANEIDKVEHSSDLSRRIEIATNDKEIQNLCNSYNKMLDRIELLFKNQERFTGDVSHELRSPLTVILAESEFGYEDAKTIDEKDTSLKVIHRQTRRITDMVNQMLEFSRVASIVSVDLKENNLSQIVSDLVLSKENNDKKISIHTDLEPQIFVKTDETLCSRMITNIIDNAVKYGKQDGNIYITLKKINNIAELKIADDGIGISAEALPHIFDRMYQVQKSRTAGNGLGLGLSFVKEISRLLQVEISVESKPDEGTTFILKFRI